LQRTEHVNGGDGFACEFGRDIQCDDGEPEHLDVKHLAGCAHGLEVLPAVSPQAKIEVVSGNGLLIFSPSKLVSCTALLRSSAS
jgi:hypothetical protein